MFVCLLGDVSLLVMLFLIFVVEIFIYDLIVIVQLWVVIDVFVVLLFVVWGGFVGLLFGCVINVVMCCVCYLNGVLEDGGGLVFELC